MRWVDVPLVQALCDAMTTDDWTKLVSVKECPAGRAKIVTVGGCDLAIFHLTDPDRFVVTRNSCPHAGASLATGEFEGEIITCSWHHWSFDLVTGRCTNAENATLHRFETRVEDGHVWVKLRGL